MSMLLEALRKSEQRQRARTVPGINSDIPTFGAEQPAHDRSRARLAGVFALALVVTGAAVAAWYWWPQPVAIPGPPAASISPAADPSAPAPANATGPEVTRAADVVAPPPTGEAAVTGPARNTRQRAQPASPVAKLPAAATVAATDGPAANPAQPAIAADRPPRQVPPMPASAAPSRPSGRAAATETAEPEPISYWALPDAVRSQLPDMKISVLVFAEEPAERFVLMNGRRLTEGAQLQDGLSLEQVRRDGAVMRFKMYRFLVRND